MNRAGFSGELVLPTAVAAWSCFDGSSTRLRIPLVGRGRGWNAGASMGVEVVNAAPWSFELRAFGLVEPDHALGQGIVIAVPDCPD